MDAHDPPPPAAPDSRPIARNPELAARNPEPVARNFSSAKYTASDYAFQFITVTAGVLIALLVNGFVELRSNRELVRDARATLTREIADNKKEVDSTLAGYEGDAKSLDNAIKFATDLLSTKATTVHELKFHVNLAELSSTGWRTAERTGALSHMDYDEVQKFSKLYDWQDVVEEQQRNLVGLLAEASALLSSDFDPDKPNPRDLEAFRENVIRLRATLSLMEKMVKRLSESYAEALKP